MRFVIPLEKARKDYTDKLGRKWHWNGVKYEYVRKGTKQKLPEGPFTFVGSYVNLEGEKRWRLRESNGNLVHTSYLTFNKLVKLGRVANYEELPNEILQSRYAIAYLNDIKKFDVINSVGLRPSSFYTYLTSSPSYAKQWALKNFKVKIVGKITAKNDFTWSHILFQLDLMRSLGFVNKKIVKISFQKKGIGKDIFSTKSNPFSTIRASYDAYNKTIYLGSTFSSSFIHEYMHHLDLNHINLERHSSANLLDSLKHYPKRFTLVAAAEKELVSDPLLGSDVVVEKREDRINYLKKPNEIIARLGESIVYHLVKDKEKEYTKNDLFFYADYLLGTLSWKFNPSESISHNYFDANKSKKLYPLFMNYMQSARSKKKKGDDT